MLCPNIAFRSKWGECLAIYAVLDDVKQFGARKAIGKVVASVAEAPQASSPLAQRLSTMAASRSPRSTRRTSVYHRRSSATGFAMQQTAEVARRYLDSSEVENEQGSSLTPSPPSSKPSRASFSPHPPSGAGASISPRQRMVSNLHLASYKLQGKPHERPKASLIHSCGKLLALELVGNFYKRLEENVQHVVDEGDVGRRTFIDLLKSPEWEGETELVRLSTVLHWQADWESIRLLEKQDQLNLMKDVFEEYITAEFRIRKYHSSLAEIEAWMSKIGPDAKVVTQKQSESKTEETTGNAGSPSTPVPSIFPPIRGKHGSKQDNKKARKLREKEVKAQEKEKKKGSGKVSKILNLFRRRSVETPKASDLQQLQQQEQEGIKSMLENQKAKLVREKDQIATAIQALRETSKTLGRKSTMNRLLGLEKMLEEVQDGVSSGGLSEVQNDWRQMLGGNERAVRLGRRNGSGFAAGTVVWDLAWRKTHAESSTTDDRLLIYEDDSPDDTARFRALAGVSDLIMAAIEQSSIEEETQGESIESVLSRSTTANELHPGKIQSLSAAVGVLTTVTKMLRNVRHDKRESVLEQRLQRIEGRLWALDRLLEGDTPAEVRDLAKNRHRAALAQKGLIGAVDWLQNTAVAVEGRLWRIRTLLMASSSVWYHEYDHNEELEEEDVDFSDDLQYSETVAEIQIREGLHYQVAWALLLHVVPEEKMDRKEINMKAVQYLVSSVAVSVIYATFHNPAQSEAMVRRRQDLLTSFEKSLQHSPTPVVGQKGIAETEISGKSDNLARDAKVEDSPAPGDDSRATADEDCDQIPEESVKAQCGIATGPRGIYDEFREWLSVVGLIDEESDEDSEDEEDKQEDCVSDHILPPEALPFLQTPFALNLRTLPGGIKFLTVANEEVILPWRFVLMGSLQLLKSTFFSDNPQEAPGLLENQEELLRPGISFQLPKVELEGIKRVLLRAGSLDAEVAGRIWKISTECITIKRMKDEVYEKEGGGSTPSKETQTPIIDSSFFDYGNLESQHLQSTEILPRYVFLAFVELLSSLAGSAEPVLEDSEGSVGNESSGE